MTREEEPVALPNPEFLARNANRQRQPTRPRHPDHLNFDLQRDYIEADFLVADIWVNERRHLMFATDHQLGLLKTCRHWFADGTFKVFGPSDTHRYTKSFFIRII